MIVPVAATYVACGGLLAIGRAVRPATLPLIAVAGLIATILHTDLGPGGIGEYALDQHGPMNVSALLVQLAMVGALMLTFAAPHADVPFDLRAFRLGRSLLGGYFVADALWQASFYDDQVVRASSAGGNEAWLPVLLAVQILFGVLIVADRAVRLSAIVLLVATLLGSFVVFGDPAAGVVPPSARPHGWLTRGALTAGLLQLWSIAACLGAPIATDPPATYPSP